MGLELVELMMSVEQDLGITIPDRDAERIQTPGALAEYLADRLREFAVAPGRCASQRAFHELRAALVAQPGIPRSRVRPDAFVVDVVCADPRAWDAVAGSLMLPRRRSGLLWRWDRRSIPGHVRLRDLVRHRVEHGPYRFVREGTVDGRALWETVARHVAEAAGLDPAHVRPDAHLVYDLHLD
jgi:hypothetical protein